MTDPLMDSPPSTLSRGAGGRRCGGVRIRLRLIAAFIFNRVCRLVLFVQAITRHCVETVVFVGIEAFVQIHKRACRSFRSVNAFKLRACMA